MSLCKKFITTLALLVILGGLVLGAAKPAQAAVLSPEEIAGILYMREEEKLAHDVYEFLYQKWGLRTFQNISCSEQNHTDAVKTLIDRYGLQDPASNQPGVFTNPYLQSLYNDLVVWGEQSLEAALRVGGAIEEIDILDLQRYLAETNKFDIRQVYDHLLNGSYNHLRAFVSRLSALYGETYQPLYLDPVTYQEIIDGRGGRNCRHC